jgi:hypothetical protein
VKHEELDSDSLCSHGGGSPDDVVRKEHSACVAENLAEFTSPDKARQVGYFPLTAGNHTIEVKAEGFKPLSKTLHIITGEEGVQNMHLHLERNEKSR